MPMSGVRALTASNTIEVDQTGVYDLNYFADVNPNQNTALTFAVRRNNVNIPETVSTRNLTAGTDAIFSGSPIVFLNSGDTLDMVISSPDAAQVSLSDGGRASLSSKKLDA